MKPSRLGSDGVPIERIEATAYRIPTEEPESDGTHHWHSTTVVVVEATAGGAVGLGWSYTEAAAGRVIGDRLAPAIEEHDALAPTAAHGGMVRAVRNAGRPGIASCAIAAVDVALWDLKARLLEIPLVTLLGAVREGVPVYGSGGFTSQSIPTLRQQLASWVEMGIPRVKMKVGREPAEDVARVAAARDAIGPDAELYVDANGAYHRKQALAFADRFAEYGVTWFEEPVTSDDLEGLRFLRDRGPAGMEIAAGEHGYDLPYFRRMLVTGAVDVLMPDATRCGGITVFLDVGALCEAHAVPMSAHTAPGVHAHPACARASVRHIEFFHDHARIERMFFDGFPEPEDGVIRPDLSRPGHGMELKRPDVKRYMV